MIKRKVAEIDSLVDGLDTFVNPTEISDGATPDCMNVIPTGKGAFKTRLGRIKHGGEIASGYGGQGYFTYINASGATEELVVVNGVLKRKNGTSWDTISGGTLSTTAKVYAAQVGSRLYFADGATALCYYDGTNISTSGINSAPLPSFLIFYNRRLYCNDINNPDRIYFSGAMAADGTVANTGDFRSTTPAFGGYTGFGKGREVTALAKLGSTHLVIGLKDGIHRVAPVADSGTSTALTHSEEMLSNSVGIACHGTVDNIENDLGFLAWGDVYLLGEVASYSSLRTRVISTKVSETIQAISNTNIKKTCGIYSPREKKYYLGLADGNVLVYDTYYKSWWMFNNWHPAAFVEYFDASNNHFLGYLSYSDSYVHEMNVGQDDDGTQIDWYWKSKVFDLKGFDLSKKFKRWSVLFGPVFGTVSVNLSINGEANVSDLTIGTPTTSTTGFGCMPYGWKPYGQYTNDLGTVIESLANDWRWKKISRPNEGTQIQFEFSGGGANEAGQIEKMKVYYQENDRKKDRTKRIM